MPQLPRLTIDAEPPPAAALKASCSSPSVSSRRGRVEPSSQEYSGGSPRRVAVDGAPAASADALPDEIIVSRELAMRKWPDLSPRAALLKEETIQRLAALPAGELFRVLGRARMAAPTAGVVRTTAKRHAGARVRPSAEGSPPSAGVPSPEQHQAAFNPALAMITIPSPLRASTDDKPFPRSVSFPPIAEPSSPTMLKPPELRASRRAEAARVANILETEAATKAAMRRAEEMAEAHRVRAARLAGVYGSYTIAGVHQHVSHRAARAGRRELRSSKSMPEKLGGAKSRANTDRGIDTSLSPPRYELVERRAVGGSFSRLPRLDGGMQLEQQPEGRRARRRDRSCTHEANASGEGSRRAAPPRPPPPTKDDLIDAALPTAHAAAAIAAAEAVAKERSEKARRAMDATVGTMLAVNRFQAKLKAKAKAKMDARLLASGVKTDEAWELTNRRDEIAHERVKVPIVAEAIACKKWPNLSPRSALEKEIAIQRLAALPEGIMLEPEVSSVEVMTRISAIRAEANWERSLGRERDDSDARCASGL